MLYGIVKTTAHPTPAKEDLPNVVPGYSCVQLRTAYPGRVVDPLTLPRGRPGTGTTNSSWLCSCYCGFLLRVDHDHLIKDLRFRTHIP